MGTAVDRLATELRNLPANEWKRLDMRRTASRERDEVLGQASYAEIAERLRETDLAAGRINRVGGDAGIP